MKIITIEHLREGLKALEESAEPLREEFEIAEKKFKDACDELEKPYKKLTQEFYDQQLKDKDNSSIQEKHIITDGKNNYRVVKRGVHFLFGEILNNPHVKVIRVGGKREKTLSKSELTNYKII